MTTTELDLSAPVSHDVATMVVAESLVELHAHDLAKLARLHEFSQLDVERGESQYEANDEHALLVGGKPGLLHCEAVFDGGCQWLFAENVLFVFEGLDHMVFVGIVPGAD